MGMKSGLTSQAFCVLTYAVVFSAVLALNWACAKDLSGPFHHGLCICFHYLQFRAWVCFCAALRVLCVLDLAPIRKTNSAIVLLQNRYFQGGSLNLIAMWLQGGMLNAWGASEDLYCCFYTIGRAAGSRVLVGS